MGTARDEDAVARLQRDAQRAWPFGTFSGPINKRRIRNNDRNVFTLLALFLCLGFAVIAISALVVWALGKLF